MGVFLKSDTLKHERTPNDCTGRHGAIKQEYNLIQLNCIQFAGLHLQQSL